MTRPTFFDVRIRGEDPDHFRQDALGLATAVRGDWRGSDLRTKHFGNGVTNFLIGIYKEGDTEDVVLVRVYGNGTEKFIDHDAELHHMEVLYAHGCGSNIYAKFHNGIAYALIPGRALTRDQVREPRVAKMIAENMARMHKIVPHTIISETNRSSKLWTMMKKFLSLAPDGADGFDDLTLRQRAIDAGVVSKVNLMREISTMESALKNCASPVVFCHNDLIYSNVILLPGGDEVRFIDYEFSMDNYQAFDVAQHFTGMVGIEGELDLDSYYPGKAFQIEWIKHYLTAYNGRDPERNELEAAYNLVCKFSVCSHLLWSIWSLLMAPISTFDFDYIHFHCQRMKAYSDGKHRYYGE